MNDVNRYAVPTVVRYDESDCPVCSLGYAFSAPRNYEVCARCGWIDDPAAYANPEQRYEMNEASLREARSDWPARLAQRLREGPWSSFGVASRTDKNGGYDYLVDRASVRAIFRAGNLKAAIDRWPGGDEFGLGRGVPDTPTGRFRLYVCSICGGDDYERSLTADVYVGRDCVVWSRIGFEEYMYERDEWALDVRFGPAGFAFNAEEYRRTLAAARS